MLPVLNSSVRLTKQLRKDKEQSSVCLKPMSISLYKRLEPEKLSLEGHAKGLLGKDCVLIQEGKDILESRFGIFGVVHLLLNFYEATFLLEIGVLEVLDAKGDKVEKRRILDHAKKEQTSFTLTYPVYRHFCQRGWYIRSGLNYGTNFVLYPDKPDSCHSVFAVLVLGPDEEMPAYKLFGAVRSCGSALKTLLIAIPVKVVECLDEEVKVKVISCRRWDPNHERISKGLDALQIIPKQ